MEHILSNVINEKERGKEREGKGEKTGEREKIKKIFQCRQSAIQTDLDVFSLHSYRFCAQSDKAKYFASQGYLYTCFLSLSYLIPGSQNTHKFYFSYEND